MTAYASHSYKHAKKKTIWDRETIETVESGQHSHKLSVILALGKWRKKDPLGSLTR